MTGLMDRTKEGQEGPLYYRGYPLELRLSRERVENSKTPGLDFCVDCLYFYVKFCSTVQVLVAYELEIGAKRQFVTSNESSQSSVIQC